ncbi:MAG: UDP-glucose 4-epimerase GalE [Pseudomonadota bacterium]|nr:UDP-glucose 4-epimerase GalE [Pseudomonadota bacterium]
MNTVLVTGGAGYVGSHCCKALGAAGYLPVTFDNLSTGHRDLVKWGPLVEGDVRDTAAVAAAIAEHRPVAAMHFAALALVGESMRHPDRYYDINLGGTLALLRALTAGGVGALVFSSTCAVYGEPGEASIVEELSKAPVNPYGFTKLACERMMADFEAAGGPRHAPLRYFNAAGADPDGETGEHHENETHIIPIVLDVALGRRESVQIMGTDYPTPDGSAIRDYIHVADLADAHLRALNRLLEGGASRPFNLGTGTGTSVREIVGAVEAVTGRSVACSEAPRRPGDPPRLVASASRAATELGWQPRRSDIKTIVADAWDWHQRRHGTARPDGAANDHAKARRYQ